MAGEAGTSRFVKQVRRGDRFTSRLAVTPEVVRRFAHASGDENPLHMDFDSARRLGFPSRVAHGAILLAEISRIIGTELPGEGSLWLSSDVEFQAPVYVGDTVVVDAVIAHVSGALDVVVMEFGARRESDGVHVLTGTAKVMVLEERMALSFRPLDQQRIIVSGGTRGLGRVISRTLMDAGATVIALYRSDSAAAEHLAEEARNASGTLHNVCCDVADSRAVEDLFGFIRDDVGGVDSFVHAASPPLEDLPFEELTWDSVQSFLEVSVKGCLEIVKGCAPYFRSAGVGRVVLLGSEAVQAPRRHWTHYVVAKSSYIGLVRALAVELAESNTTVNMISPGTLHASDILPQNVKAMTRNATPLKRLASEEEVGEVVAFLLEKGGSFMSGANIPLTGGRIFFA